MHYFTDFEISMLQTQHACTLTYANFDINNKITADVSSLKPQRIYCLIFNNNKFLIIRRYNTHLPL
jgi:hypothetical protein